MVAVNHVIGAVVTIVSALLLSRILGPEIFAVYAFCTSLSGVTRMGSRLGVNAYLLTQKEEPDDHHYHVALGIMLLFSVVVACGTTLLLPLIAKFSRISDLFWPGVVTVAIMPLHVFPLPAITRMERALRFRPLVVTELASQILGQAVGIGLALNGWGIWGPLTGWVVRAFFYAMVPWMLSGSRASISWDPRCALRMTKYGLGYVAATGLSQSRGLILLSVVGRVVGQEAVGYMGLTLRAVGLIAPFRAAAARVILPALSPIAHIPSAVRSGVQAVVETETLLSVPATILATAVYLPSIHFLGPAWQPTAALFPWVAAGSLLASAHAASLSTLHIRGYFFESITSTCIGLVALVGSLAVLGRWGVEGCAMATVAVWPSFWVQEWFAARRVGTTWSKNGVAWAVGGASACLSWRLGPLALTISAATWLATISAISHRGKAILNIVTSVQQAIGIWHRRDSR